jgi:hypothetical protein
MTDPPVRQTSTVPTAEDVVPPAAPSPSGWVVFGAVLLVLAAVLHAVEGLVALTEPDHYLTGSAGLAVPVSWTTWGWAHIALGVAAFLAGLGLLAGARPARVAAVVIACLSAVVHVAFAAAQPFWSVIVIALDVAVIFAAVVHGRDLRATSS